MMVLSPIFPLSNAALNQCHRNIRPIHSVTYRAAAKARDLKISETCRMLLMNVVKLDRAESASLVVLAPNKVETLRFSVDYWTIDTTTTLDSYPLVRMEECIDSFGDGHVYSTLDDNNGYWRIKANKLYKDKNMLALHHELYKLTSIPFSLKYAPITLHLVMNFI